MFTAPGQRLSFTGLKKNCYFCIQKKLYSYNILFHFESKKITAQCFEKSIEAKRFASKIFIMNVLLDELWRLKSTHSLTV